MGLPVVTLGITAPPIITVRIAPAVVASPFDSDNLPEDEAPTGARPFEPALVYVTGGPSRAMVTRFHPWGDRPS